jgi:hypothetical protein
LSLQKFRRSRRLDGGHPARHIMQFSPRTGRQIQEVAQVEDIEYRTVACAEDAARMLQQLNELGVQGWEVCAETNARTGSKVIGRVAPWHEVHVLLLKRHNKA